MPSATSSTAPVQGTQATLVITDAHTGMLLPSLWYSVPITGTAGGVTSTISVKLLVGGARLYLPLVVREE